MTPEDRLLKEIDDITKKAMKKRLHSARGYFEVKKKCKFRSTIKPL